MMLDQTFYKRIQRLFSEMHTIIPLDVALSGASISRALYIDARRSMSAIAKTDIPAGSIDRTWITEAFPPFDADNIFIEFNSHTFESQKIGLQPGAMGLHLTSYELAKHGKLFSEYVDIPERVTRWEKKYVSIIYRDMPDTVSAVAAGTVVALNEEGGIAEIGSFPVVIGNLYDERLSLMEKYLAFAAMVTTFAFSVFAMINQGEATLVRRGENHWEV